MHNGRPFAMRGNIARSLAERRDCVAALLLAPDNETRATGVGISF
jgi:hypothetical protein